MFKPILVMSVVCAFASKTLAEDNANAAVKDGLHRKFMLRKQVLKLYKDILICIREIPSAEDQKELREWVRGDFKANKNQKDEHAVKSLLKYGERSLKELQQNINLSR